MKNKVYIMIVSVILILYYVSVLESASSNAKNNNVIKIIYKGAGFLTYVNNDLALISQSNQKAKKNYQDYRCEWKSQKNFTSSG